MIRLGILTRAAAPVAALTLLTAVCWTGTADLRHPAPGGAAPFVDLVAAASAWALLLALGWLLLITLVVVAEVASSRRADRRWSRGLGCPPALRRAVLIGCGLSVLLTAAPATAADSDAVAPLDLTGLVLPDRALSTPAGDGSASQDDGGAHRADPDVTSSSTPTLRGSSQSRTPAAGPESSTPTDRATPIPRESTATRGADSRATSTAPTAQPVPRTPQPPSSDEQDGSGTRARGTAPAVTVRAGDTLWALARDHLPDSAGPAAVAAEVERWHTTNDAIVADPDLIHPGQRLAAPDPIDRRTAGPTHDTEENR